MWILTPSLTSRFAAATAASTLASNEQLAEAFAQSLMWRSSRSRSPIWLQRLRKNSWTKHLSGAICDPSLGESFTDWWTSSLAATRANPSAQPANASAPKTHDTSGLTYQPELLQCDQQSAFLRMSKDTFLSGCATSCKTWSDWVTERRGAWRARVNAARLTSGKGSSSWPTIRASEYKDVGPVGSKSHDHMLGKHYLCAVVTQEESNGQAAPASSSSRGSRQGLSDQSQRNWQTFAPGTNNRGMTPHRQVVKALVQGSKAKTQMLTVDQVFAEEIKKQELWPTITAHTPDMESNGPNGHSGTYLAGAVKSWMTPRACEAQNPPMGVDKRHQGLTHQVKHGWLTPKVPSGGSQSQRTTPGGGLRKLEDQTEKASGKLNPRWVETLMGLPIGWTMPSCTSPQTIAPMSCDSSAMESACPPLSVLGEFSLASWPSPRLNENQQTEELGLLWAENGFKQPKTRGGKARANGSTFDVTLETAARGVAAMEATT